MKIYWRRPIINWLLWLLNTRLLNGTPCRYGHIGNCDAFDYSFLDSSDRQEPGITVRRVLDDADRFNACFLKANSLTVLEPDGTSHEATAMDVHELRLALTPKEPDADAR